MIVIEYRGRRGDRDLPPLGRTSRVIVVGTSGSGKSTLGTRLAAALGVPDVELDRLYWKPGWVESPIEEFRARIAETLAGAKGWVINGNYNKVRDCTWGACDTIVWLDYSRFVVMARVLWRTVARVALRRRVCNGNVETFRQSFLSRDSIIRWAWTSYARRRAQCLEYIAHPEYPTAQFIVIRKPRHVEAFVRAFERGVA
jgi:adenylate kinase family enzyme